MVALLHHAAGPDARAGRGVLKSEEAAVRLERVGHVGAGPARVAGPDGERRAVRARPGHERAVLQPDAVAQPREVERLDAAVGHARHADAPTGSSRPGPPAGRAGAACRAPRSDGRRGGSSRGRSPGSCASPACRTSVPSRGRCRSRPRSRARRRRRCCTSRPASAPRTRSCCRPSRASSRSSGTGRRRSRAAGHVDVERHAVPARHALGVARGGAEQHAVLRDAGVAEGQGRGGMPAAGAGGPRPRLRPGRICGGSRGGGLLPRPAGRAVLATPVRLRAHLSGRAGRRRGAPRATPRDARRRRRCRASRRSRRAARSRPCRCSS